MQSEKNRNRFFATLIGTVLIGLCCFTPVLVILLISVGLASFTLYLDFVLFPALFIMIVLTVISYRKYTSKK